MIKLLNILDKTIYLLLIKVAFGNVNYEQKGRPEYLENKFLEQGQEPTSKCKTCNNKKGLDHHFSEVQSWNLYSGDTFGTKASVP